MIPGEADRHLELKGTFLRAGRLGHGHINDTYLAEFEGGPSVVFQRVNRVVFPDPEALMANVERVTEHLAARCPDERRVLRLLRARSGRGFWRDAAGELWRAYRYVDGALTRDEVGRPREAYEAARVFAGFLYLLSDLPGPALSETLPGFHDTPARLAALEAAAREDDAGRSKEAAAELAFARANAGWAALLASAGLPRRTVHNDTKLNNVLFDADTGRGLCVIDLDTVMPGTALFDFGDLVRATISPAAEDERDLSKVAARPEVFEAVAQGWRDGSGGGPSEAERALMPAAGRVIAYELGLRFLTDHLRGDRYFRVGRPGHNLDRARCQFRLAEELLRREPDLRVYC
ncbi:MAG: aminoglycoside phosphotransferase family protein [Elusimicrobia bacterium]|nr:aminoglycoside phosphotransferase family protein [Elusimicrobiota bacterium]